MSSTAAGPVPPPGARTGIGVLGGAFDPPHASHRRVAAGALDLLPLGELRVIPAGDHPFKREPGMTPAAHRLAMCRLAFADLPGARVDAREVERGGLSFTVDTLAQLAAEHPGRRLWLLLGSDNLTALPAWREPERIVALATIATYPRLGHPATAAALAAAGVPAAMHAALLAHVLPLPADDVASSALRARLRAGEREPAEIAPAVRRYIEEHGLYR